MTDFDLADLASVDVKQFAQLVKSTPDARIAAVLGGDQRGAILGEIFDRFPALFRADKAGGMTAVIHWMIDGRADGGRDTYQVAIADGTCTTSSTADQDPRLTIIIGAVDFVKLVSGNGNPMMMFMTGRLKAKGDLGLAANIASLFDLPKA